MRFTGVIAALLLVPAVGQAESWTDLVFMDRARGFTATKLQDGRVLVAGGRSSAGYPDTALMYDGAPTWTPVSRMSQGGRWLHSAVLLADGKVLVVGGYVNGWNLVPRAEIYDPVSDSWTPTFYDPNHPQPRGNRPSLTVLDGGKVLAAGGADNTAQIYDPVTDSWTSTGSMSVGRHGHTAIKLNDGRVLVYGGAFTEYVNMWWDTSAELYDPNTGTWSPAPPTSVARSTGVLLDDGTVLVEGGPPQPTSCSYCLCDATAELYVPDANGGAGMWQTTASMGDGRGGHTATKLKDGRVLVAGGLPAGQTGAFEKAEIYDPETRSWTPALQLNRGRTDHTATALNTGKVLVVGGGRGENEPIYIPELYRP